ncbi:MAG: bis(5'-nucleosyl)-tetraphosphatase (symmetrical) YqeK, partial [Clostridia bacterium]|nr:bis(5'-nucleosyl)-tetraphosphatase (symmetrical) YqeK [Clostridia bacterium]
MGKILLFGGTFDPPHKGHRHLLRSAMEQEQFDRVLLIPAYIPPHKDHHPALSFEVRCGILKDWFGDIAGLEISALEQERGGKSFTVDTVEAILAENPGEELYLLIGTDMFLSFETWCRFEDLLKKVFLIVGSREIGDLSKLEAFRDYLKSKYTCKGIILCSMEPVVCASSDLRAAGNGLAQRALEHIGKEMDVKRARHTMQVANYAKRLAPNVGVDPEKAYLAGLLHDCTKCYTTEWQVRYAKEQGITLSDEDLASPQILHQITGAVFAQKFLGAEDEEILSAIGCHTTGKPGMTPLEMLLFFADSCEPSRTYPGVEKLRMAGEANLKEGTLMLFDGLIASLIDKKAYLHPKTLEAR